MELYKKRFSHEVSSGFREKVVGGVEEAISSIKQDGRRFYA